MPSYCNAVACMRGCTSAKSATRTPPNLLTQSQTMTHTPPHTHLRARLLAASLLACATLATLLPAHTAQAQYSPAPAVSQPQTTLPRTRLQLGRKTISVQVASTPEQRQIGLMHRKTMPANDGMLFVFEREGMQCFWMKNTLLPLTAAFIASDGTIINLADMQPHSEASHCSERPARYVLEMHQGWFARQRIAPGMKLRDVGGQLFR